MTDPWDAVRAAAIGTAQIGLWQTEGDTDRLHLDERSSELLGLPGTSSLGDMLDLVEDRTAANALHTHLRDSTDELLTPPHRLRRSDGHIVHVHFVARRGGGGWHGGLWDASMAAERHARTERAERLQYVGRLSAGVSHNFNNILMVVEACLSDLEATVHVGVPADARMRKTVQDALEATRRASTVVDDLAQLVRQDPAEAQTPVSVASLCHDVAKGRRRVLPPGVTLSVDITTAAWVRQSPGQLEQVLDNLLGNAADAVAGRSDARIVLIARDVDSFGVPSVELVVADNGPGVEPQLGSRLFEPFVSTKGHGGTGLGLASADHLVTRMDGQLAHRPREGGGTEFLVLLQQVEPIRPQVADAPARDLAGLRVLLIDDEPAIRQILTRILEREGCVVATAGEAAGARHELQEGFDVVLLDRTLGLDRGESLVDDVRSACPTARLLYFTGEPVPDAEAAAVDGVLRKPIRRRQLIQALGGS